MIHPHINDSDGKRPTRPLYYTGKNIQWAEQWESLLILLHYHVDVGPLLYQQHEQVGCGISH